MNTEIKAGIHNRFDLEVIEKSTGKIRQKAYAENVVCNGLYESIKRQTPWFGGISFGSGTGTPSETDSQLFSFVGTKAAGSAEYGRNDSEGWVSAVRSIRLLETEYVGETLTEVGITGYGLSTHAMLQDMNGNPISIEKTDSDIINIYATTFVHFNADGYSNGSIRVHPSLCNNQDELVNNIAGTILDVLLGIRGNSQTTINVLGGRGYYAYGARTIASTYDPSVLKKITYTLNRIPAAGMNDVHGIFGFGITNTAISFIDESKYVVTDEVIGTGDGEKRTFRTKFYPEKNVPFTIKVNGVSITEVETPDVPVHANALDYLTPISKDSTDENIIPALMYTQASGMRRFYNPFYQKTGIYRGGNYTAVRVSNDLITWISVNTNIPEEYQKYKFIETTGGTEDITYNENETYNIVFDEPPAVGAIITASYTSVPIPKDENHVYDASLAIFLGAYTPE